MIAVGHSPNISFAKWETIMKKITLFSRRKESSRRSYQMKKATYISLALTLFLLASAEQASACSCLRSLEPVKKQVQRAFTDSTAIFSGEVLEISESAADENSLLVKLKVATSWKGKLNREVTITTAENSAMCGYTFEVGKKYLVYANGAEGSLMVSSCSRTTNMSNKNDVKYLAKLKRQKRGIR
jgi:hypothetical protein